MKSPFKFLDSFTKDDREIFFGREKEIEELYQRIFRSKIMLVYGVSGTGKSSLINCGLANKFRDEDWLPVNVRRGKNILESMYAAIVASSLTTKAQFAASETQFRKCVKSLYLDHYKPIYFIFDQFEELFIFGTKEEKSQFVKVIKAIVDSDIQCRFIFVMREEYMANVTEFEKHIPVFFSNRVRIENMDINNAIQAIKGPCRVANISIEEGFPEALIENLSPGSPDIELTYLQVFLDKIYRMSAEEGGETISFTLEQLKKIGNVSDLLGAFLNEQISLLSDPDSALAVLKSFVSIKGTKRQMNLDEVKEYSQTLGKPIRESVLLEMLQNFVNLRILRDKDQYDRYELRHDSLATKIYEKISGVEKDILEIRQFIEDGYHNWEKRGILLSASDLEYIAPYESRLFLSSELLNFITQSKNQLEKVKKRRRSIFMTATSVLLVIFAGFTIWALSEKQKSNHNFIKARANSYNFLSQKVVETDPTTALRLAEYARSVDSLNPDIVENINRIYYDNNFYRIISKEAVSLRSMEFAPDGKSILTNIDGSVTLRDLNGKKLFALPENIIYSQAFSPDGNLILTASPNKTLTLWNLNGKILQVYKGHLNEISSMAFSPDGKTILTGSYDRTARLWDLNGNEIKVFKGHKKGITSVAFSPDGKTILTGSNDKTVRLWNLNGNVLKVLKDFDDGIRAVAFSPDGKSILTYSLYIIRLLDLKGNLLHQWKGNENSIYSFALSPDGNNLLTGYSDKTASIWDMQGNLIMKFKGHDEGVNSVAFSRDGKMIVTGSFDGQINLWKLKGSGVRIVRHSDGFISVRNSPDGKYILTGSYDNTVILWDLKGNILQTFKDHTGPVSSVAFSPDGSTFLSGSFDKTILLRDLKGNIIQQFKGHESEISSVEFSPDGKSILTGSKDRTARLWDLHGKVLQVFKGHLIGVTSAVFSPDGKNILTSASDRTSILWDLQGNKIKIFKGTGQECYSVVFSNDGKSVFTSSGNNTVKRWDLNGNLLQVFKGSSEISAIALSPDGKTVLASSYDFLVHLWDIEGTELQTFKGHESDIYSITFSSDGKSFVSCSKDGTFRICEIKEDLKSFMKEDAYEKLSFSQKIKYGILDVNDILKLNDKKSLYEAAEYYYNEINLVGEDRKKEFHKNSEKLFKQGLNFDTLQGPIARRLTKLYIDNDQYSKDFINLEIDKYFNLLLKTNDINDLIMSLTFYVAGTDSSTVSYRYSDKAISIGQKLMDLSNSDLDIRSQISSSCSNLSLFSIYCRQYKNSLTAVKIAIKADSTNKYSYTNLPLAYLLNDMYNEAEKEYIKWKDKPWTSDREYKTFREVFLADLADVENLGISHPDFAKVKELLKK